MLMPFLDGKRAPAFFVYSAIIKFRDKKGIITMKLPLMNIAIAQTETTTAMMCILRRPTAAGAVTNGS